MLTPKIKKMLGFKMIQADIVPVEIVEPPRKKKKGGKK